MNIKYAISPRALIIPVMTTMVVSTLLTMTPMNESYSVPDLL